MFKHRYNAIYTLFFINFYDGANIKLTPLHK